MFLGIAASTRQETDRVYSVRRSVTATFRIRWQDPGATPRSVRSAQDASVPPNINFLTSMAEGGRRVPPIIRPEQRRDGSRICRE